MKLIFNATLLSLSAAVILFLGIRFTGLDESHWEILFPVLIAVCVITVLCFITGEITGNYSQVDKLWSILPVGYGWYFALASGGEPRGILMAALTTLWGVRLTYNFIRRGGYSLIPWRGEEDYRWAVIRRSPFFQGHPLRFSLFNLLFICTYQNFLIFLFSSPALFAGDAPLNLYDYILVVFYIALLITETIADQQQYDFQTEKQALLKKGELPQPYRDGFVKQGLWKYARHPNYACEQGIWLCLYLMSVIPTGTINPSGIGIILLMLLFYSSSNFSEAISSEKYPPYREYIRTTPRFLPSVIALVKVFSRK